MGTRILFSYNLKLCIPKKEETKTLPEKEIKVG